MSNHITLNRINDKTKFFSEFRSRMSIIEGNDKFVYFDGAGNATTGIGFNLRDKGVVDILKQHWPKNTRHPQLPIIMAILRIITVLKSMI